VVKTMMKANVGKINREKYDLLWSKKMVRE
jgi:hypothetical protein